MTTAAPMGLQEAAAHTSAADEAGVGLLGAGAKPKTGKARCCEAFRMLTTGCTLGVLAMIIAGLGYVAPDIHILSPHILAVCAFLVAAQLPSVTAFVFMCARSPKAGLVHIGVSACVAVLVCCGLITNIRILNESDMSEYCETHLFWFPCTYTTDAATMVTLLLIGLVAIVASLACFYAYRLRKIFQAAMPQPITAEAP